MILTEIFRFLGPLLKDFPKLDLVDFYKPEQMMNCSNTVMGTIQTEMNSHFIEVQGKTRKSLSSNPCLTFFQHFDKEF